VEHFFPNNKIKIQNYGNTKTTKNGTSHGGLKPSFQTPIHKNDRQ